MTVAQGAWCAGPSSRTWNDAERLKIACPCWIAVTRRVIRPLHTMRGTGVQEKLLKNAKTEYTDEAQEIATYLGIEAFAEAVGDRETARLARTIRREEERMAAFLVKEISRLTRAVATAEIPAAQRRKPRRARASSRRPATRSRS